MLAVRCMRSRAIAIGRHGTRHMCAPASGTFPHDKFRESGGDPAGEIPKVYDPGAVEEGWYEWWSGNDSFGAHVAAKGAATEASIGGDVFVPTETVFGGGGRSFSPSETSLGLTPFSTSSSESSSSSRSSSPPPPPPCLSVHADTSDSIATARTIPMTAHRSRFQTSIRITVAGDA